MSDPGQSHEPEDRSLPPQRFTVHPERQFLPPRRPADRSYPELAPPPRKIRSGSDELVSFLRILAVLGVLSCIVWRAWERPLGPQAVALTGWDWLAPTPTPSSPPVAPTPGPKLEYAAAPKDRTAPGTKTPTPTPSKWLFDPNRKTALDAPSQP